jgi:nitrogen regulatory protein P-II 1
MKMVTAIVRTSCLEKVLAALRGVGIRGLTIFEVKGVGHGVHMYTPYEVHSRIEIIIPDEEVERVTSAIVENAHTGFPGDGMIAVAPVDYVVKIRTKEKKGED